MASLGVLKGEAKSAQSERLAPHAAHHESTIDEERKLLATTLDYMDQGVMVLDDDFRLRLWNRRAVELLGLPVDFCHRGLHVSDLDSYFRLEQGLPSDEVSAAVAGDFGRDNIAILPAHAFGGRVLEQRCRALPGGGMILTYIDITEAKRRDLEIVDKRELVAATLDGIIQGILVLDSHLKVRLWNAQVRGLTDLPDHLVQYGASGSDLMRFFATHGGFGPGPIEEVVERRFRALESREIVRFEHKLDDGRTVVGHINRTPQSQHTHTVFSFTDVTRHQRELAETENLLRVTLGNMDQGIVLLDQDWRLKLWNDRIVELFGLPPDTLSPDQPFADFIRRNIDASVGPEDRERLVSERLHDIEVNHSKIIDHRATDGRVIERRRRTTPRGEVVITYADTTARYEAQETMRRAKEEANLANRSKTEFLANMSHELRTPLNAIIGFSDMLVSEILGPLGEPHYAEYARDIRDSGRHLLSLINDVLDTAKLEHNKIELTEERVDVRAIVESCLRLVREHASAGGVTISAGISSDVPNLYADERRLKQILLNLLSNAIKFTPAGGQVDTRVEADAAGYRIIVADTGIGIAQADMDRAFTPFGQIDSQLARRYNGTGLGLPIARSMAELHGGRLQIESTPNLGTIVTVWLPPNRILD